MLVVLKSTTKKVVNFFEEKKCTADKKSWLRLCEMVTSVDYAYARTFHSCCLCCLMCNKFTMMTTTIMTTDE